MRFVLGMSYGLWLGKALAEIMGTILMDLSLDDTIAALASPPGSARRGIVRISGPEARQVLADWFVPDDSMGWVNAPTARLHGGRLFGVSSRGAIRVHAYLWPGRRSYTGQTLAELHLPGSPPLLECVLSEVFRRGARPARPGEFTLRAFLGGKLDLLQAEAVLGVIDADDHAALQAALSQLAGGLSGQLTKLRSEILEILADLEAGLDFIEEDISFISRCELQGRIAIARRLVDDLLQQSSRRSQSNTRPRVVLAGLPNAGKSTLFNCLTKSDAALVSPWEGTTRDFLVAPVHWRGMAFDLIDTAGWESTSIPIALSAQEKRSHQLQSADVVVWCSAANLNATLQDQDEKLLSEASDQARAVIRVITKMDDPNACNWVMETDDAPISDRLGMATAIETSAINGMGMDDLAAAIHSHLSTTQGSARQWLGTTVARCRDSLEAVSSALERAESAGAFESIGDELIAVEIREALNHLGTILGTVYSDDILDRVFSKFCIGK